MTMQIDVDWDAGDVTLVDDSAAPGPHSGASGGE